MFLLLFLGLIIFIAEYTGASKKASEQKSPFCTFENKDILVCPTGYGFRVTGYHHTQSAIKVDLLYRRGKNNKLIYPQKGEVCTLHYLYWHTYEGDSDPTPINEGYYICTEWVKDYRIFKINRIETNKKGLLFADATKGLYEFPEKITDAFSQLVKDIDYIKHPNFRGISTKDIIEISLKDFHGDDN